MASPVAFDAAYAPDLAACVASGGVAINGYLTGDYAATTTQPAAAHAAGMGWWPTYEQARGELVGASRATGQDVGRRILAALRGHGVPLDGSVAVYPSVDVAAQPATCCDDAWRGMRDVLAGLVSLRYYGDGLVGEHLHAAGLIDGPYWLASASSWPHAPGGDVHACLVQQVGGPVPGADLDLINGDPRAIGAWWPNGSPYGGKMALTADDAQTVWAAPLHASDPPTAPHPASFWLTETWQALQVLTGQVTQIVTDLAALQAAVAALPGTPAAPAQQLTVTLTGTAVPVNH